MSADIAPSAFTTFLLALRVLDLRNESTPCQTPGIDHLWTCEEHDKEMRS